MAGPLLGLFLVLNWYVDIFQSVCPLMEKGKWLMEAS